MSDHTKIFTQGTLRAVDDAQRIVEGIASQELPG